MQTLWRANTPQLYVDVDRRRAAALGVDLQEVFNTLSATMGTFYVNDFNKYGCTWQVLMSADEQYRRKPDDADYQPYLRNALDALLAGKAPSVTKARAYG